MNEDMRQKTELLVREVLLNKKAQDHWIATTDPHILLIVDVFAKRHVDQDENTTKLDAFKMGFLLGAVFERRQKG